MANQKPMSRRKSKVANYWFSFDAFSDLLWSLEQQQFKPIEAALQNMDTTALDQRQRLQEIRDALTIVVSKIDLALAPAGAPSAPSVVARPAHS
jgi:hypothetical protein